MPAIVLTATYFQLDVTFDTICHGENLIHDYDDDDIYIMMKCVYVCLSRKMSTFLKGLSVNHESDVTQFHGFSWFLVGFHVFSRWFHGFPWFLVGFHGFSR